MPGGAVSFSCADNQIGVEGAKALAEALKVNKKVRVVYMSSVSIFAIAKSLHFMAILRAM